jgi:uracil-DNA glycosylase
MSRAFAKQLIATLPVGVPLLFNPWKESCRFDTSKNSTEAKIDRLARHLDCSAQYLLIGEAPGYQGCRYSGVAFTNERLLIDGVIPRVAKISHRLSTRRLPFSEPSATIVWKTLYNLGIAERTVLWNALQLHPFVSGNVWSNRTPTNAELAYGTDSLTLLRRRFPNATVVAVGKKAAGVLAQMGTPFHATVRHPANGGATLFATELATVICGRR